MFVEIFLQQSILFVIVSVVCWKETTNISQTVAVVFFSITTCSDQCYICVLIEVLEMVSSPPKNPNRLVKLRLTIFATLPAACEFPAESYRFHVGHTDESRDHIPRIDRHQRRPRMLPRQPIPPGCLLLGNLRPHVSTAPPRCCVTACVCARVSVCVCV